MVPAPASAPHSALSKAPAAGEADVVEQRLYEVQRKIYPRAVSGAFAAGRWALVWLTQVIFYGGVWLTWNDRQAILFDIAQRKFYIFGLVFWPQDIVYLSVLLIIAALSLFLFTAIAGRLWCGYACPQTVYTEIFLWIERRIEGERAERIRLDRSAWTTGKLARKAAKHAIWVAVALWTGFTFVAYFTPVHELWRALWSASTGPWETFWVLFYGFATYGNAGWMREQVCKYMCPYARFQSAMFDRDTLIIAYDPRRGDPRGRRGKGGGREALGDCVDCGICVQVCPTGIDIRNGLQYECIGCAACIDGCNRVMDKMGTPRGLIRYATPKGLELGWSRRQMLKRVFRLRSLIYGAVLLGVAVAGSISLWLRIPLKADIIRDRAAISREAEGGTIENVYRIQIMNTAEERRRFTIGVDGLQDISIADNTVVELDAASARMVTVRARVPSGQATGSHRIHFTVRAEGIEGVAVREKSVFIVR